MSKSGLCLGATLGRKLQQPAEDGGISWVGFYSQSQLYSLWAFCQDGGKKQLTVAGNRKWKLIAKMRMAKLYAKHVLIFKWSIWHGQCHYLHFKNEGPEAWRSREQVSSGAQIQSPCMIFTNMQVPTTVVLAVTNRWSSYCARELGKEGAWVKDTSLLKRNKLIF